MIDTTFNTLEAAEVPTRVGIVDALAKAVVATVREAIGEGLTTKADIRELRAEVGMIEWVFGFLFTLALTMAVRLLASCCASANRPRRNRRRSWCTFACGWCGDRVVLARQVLQKKSTLKMGLTLGACVW